jgi:phosphoribosyl 1,2-cyclic phosphate phosphodiesterase
MPRDRRLAEQDARREASAERAPTVHATLLGTGTSTGVPVLGCGCRVCTSEDPRDDRLRSSCHLEARPPGAARGEGRAVHLQIDTGPDFRRQALRYRIERIDAALYTHAHSDHVTGLDDLRPFFFENKTPVPCFARPHTAERLRAMFPHIFVHDEYPTAANLTLRELTGERAPFFAESRYDSGSNGRQDVPPVRVEPVPLLHGELPTCGFRVGRFAYLTDASTLPEASRDQLEGRVDTLVIDALHRRDHPTHFSIGEAVQVARRIGARETYFTHLTHSVRHAEEEPRLPEDVHLAYDGLELDVEG